MAGQSRYMRRVLLMALGVLLTLFLSACRIIGDTPQSANNPAADNARKIWDLFVPIFWISVVVFVIVQGILIVAVIRFRRKPGDPMPAPIHGNTKLEIAWTLAPALILAAIAVPTISTIADLARHPGDDALTVRVIGNQWWWAFEYPDTGVVTGDEMHVPAGRPIHLELVSNDVIHSFWAPRLFGKQDVVPGRTNTINFTADTDKIGEYYGQCAEFCGEQHALMAFRIYVDTPEDFEAWMAGQQQAARQPEPGTAEARGQEVFFSAGCIGCHTIEGAELNGVAAQGKVGPNLTHVGSRGTLGGATLSMSPENLKSWIHNTQDIKSGVKMPPFTNLTDEQLDDLVAYLLSLK